jgi:hypothetical protein
MTGEGTLETLSRREFFSRRVLGQLWQKTAELLPISVPAKEQSALIDDEMITEITEPDRSVMPEYFSSPLYSYALLSEMPWDMLVEEAKRRGINYEGRTKIDVVQEIFVGKKAAGLEG